MGGVGEVLTEKFAHVDQSVMESNGIRDASERCVGRDEEENEKGEVRRSPAVQLRKPIMIIE